MLRIARRTQARIRHTFIDAAGEPHDPPAGVAVRVFRGDVEIVTGAAINVDPDPGVFEFRFAAPHTDTLGELRVEWAATIDAIAQTFETWHEIVGHHLVTVADLRRLEPLDDDAKYPTWMVELGRDVATYALEDACNTAFTRRRRVEQVADIGKYVALARPRDAQLVSSFALDDPATALTVADWDVGPGGLVMFPTFSRYPRGLSITYDYGHRRTPPRVARAVALLAREWLQENVDAAIPERATRMDAGDASFSLVTAGEFGRGFDIPEVNAVVNAYSE